MDGKPHVCWVTNTSDTHHITPTLNNFSYYSYVTPINMQLPNGFIILTNIAETVYISDSLTLTNVYYIPTLNVNLILETKFIDSLFFYLSSLTQNILYCRRTPIKLLVQLVDMGIYMFFKLRSYIFPLSHFTCNYVQLVSFSLWNG